MLNQKTGDKRGSYSSCDSLLAPPGWLFGWSRLILGTRILLLLFLKLPFIAAAALPYLLLDLLILFLVLLLLLFPGHYFLLDELSQKEEIHKIDAQSVVALTTSSYPIGSTRCSTKDKMVDTSCISAPTPL